MLSKAFTILALTGAVIAAAINNVPTKLSLSRQFNLTGTHNILAHDQARARALTLRGSSDPVNTVVTNQAVTYTAVIEAGDPPTTYNVVVDTGSSNTWVGAVTPCPQGCSSTKNTVSVTYGSGSFSGNEIICNVDVGPGLAILQQSMGCATQSTGFAPYDGILGIGPEDLTIGTLSPDSSSIVPTVTDMAFYEGRIPSDSIGISFEPTTTSSNPNGELSWGGVDSSKFTGSINYVPITFTAPARDYWGIDQSISYGSTTILATTAGIVDTGTTLILIASDAFSQYQSQTGGVPDSNTGLLKITPSQYDNLQTLNFNVGSETYGLTPNGQIWPRSLNTAIGGTADSIYLVVADIGSPSGAGLDFIDGYTFLERFYSVYDTTGRSVGLATTPFTEATTN